MADRISNPDSYLIDLQTWGIANDFTNSLATSNGINNALQWAKNNGYTKVSLPKGNYLVEKNTPITLPGNLVFDLNESTIKIEKNNLEHYSIVTINGKQNVTVCGGIIEGDKDSHDYSNGGTHEWGNGISVWDGKNIKIEKMLIKDVTGYGIGTGGANYNHISWIYLADLESGTFDTNGIGTVNASFTRTNKYFTLFDTAGIINSYGFFSLLGNGTGAYGTDVSGNPINLGLAVFTVFFYNDANVYLGSITRRTADNVYKKYFPAGATKFKLAFRYEYAKIKTSTMTIRANTVTENLWITNCEIAGCRTLGIGMTGARRVVVENCEIHGTGGAAPGYGIDIEDGFNLNQNIIIRNNYFHDNKNGSIVVVSARNVLLEHNKFYGSVTMYGATGQNYISQYNLYNGCSGVGASNAGEFGSNIIFSKDAFVETQLYFDGNPRYEHCSFDNTTFILACTKDNTAKFVGCTFNFAKKDIGWAWIIRRGSVEFDSCVFTITAVQFYYFSNGSTDEAIRDKINITMNRCTVISKVPLGYPTVTIQCNQLTLTNNKFIGTHDDVYQAFYFTANHAIIENNDIDSINFQLDGRGTNTRLFIINNKINTNKTKIFFGTDRCEGFYVRKFEYIECTGNSVLLSLLNGVNLRVFSFYCERFLKMNDNTIISPNFTSKVQLFGAYRLAGDAAAVPALVAVLENNYVKNVTVEKNYVPQLAAPEIGNGFINLV